MVHNDTQIPAPVPAGQVHMDHQNQASIAFGEGSVQGERVTELLNFTAKYIDGIIGTIEALIP
jgi:hypothetical protein